MEEVRFTMRIHPIVMSKMKQIAKNNGRSLNKEIEQILKWVVDDYERKRGRIEVPEEPSPARPKRDIPAFPERPMDMLFRVENK